MTNRLEGKTALVTGAAQGIGRATVERFVAEGARVWATDINANKLQELSSLQSVTIKVLDVTDPNAIQAIANELESLDILVNCAGYVDGGTILDCDEDAFDFSMDLNVRAAYLMIRTCLPIMQSGGGGSIVNIASVASNIAGVPNRFIYGTSKAAVIGLTKSVAKDFVDQGIRCNSICPGTVETPSLNDRINAFDDPEAARKSFIDRQPMGRLGTAEEIAGLCVYLASDESAFITGGELIIDGGMTL